MEIRIDTTAGPRNYPIREKGEVTKFQKHWGSIPVASILVDKNGQPNPNGSKIGGPLGNLIVPKK